MKYISAIKSNVAVINVKCKGWVGGGGFELKKYVGDIYSINVRDL